MTDDKRTDEQRYEAGAKRARARYEGAGKQHPFGTRPGLPVGPAAPGEAGK